MSNGNRPNTSDVTYEMLWNCHYCDTKKLLGLTHRFCPTCGAPQDPSWRYFPSDNEKVRVESHEFTGPDKICPACSTPSSVKAKCCPNCGSTLEGGAAVAQRRDKVVKVGTMFEGETESDARTEKLPAFYAAATPGSPVIAKAADVAPSAAKKTHAFGLLAVFVTVIAVVALIVFWRKDVALTVNGHYWTREVRIESFGPVEETGWRSEIPAGAQVLRCSQQKKGARQVQDGEDCHIRKVDNGDGTFSEKRECTPKYKEEAEYEDKCTYRFNKWAYSRSEVAKGQNVAQEPAWPVVNLNMANVAVVGGEREAQRTEQYILQYTDQEGKPGKCQLSEAKWRTIATGSRWKTTASIIGNTLDCEKMVPAK